MSGISGRNNSVSQVCQLGQVGQSGQVSQVRSGLLVRFDNTIPSAVAELTEAADSEAAGAGARCGAAQGGAVVGGVAGAVGAGRGRAGVVLEGDDREEREDWGGEVRLIGIVMTNVVLEQDRLGS